MLLSHCDHGIDPLLQRAIDRLLEPKRPHIGRGARGVGTLALPVATASPAPVPTPAPAPRPRSRRVKFSHKLVYSIPHREDDGRRPPAWTLLPAPPVDPSGDIAIYNDSDDDVEERCYLANVAQNLHVAALHRMLNSGGGEGSDSEGETSEGEGEASDEENLD